MKTVLVVEDEEQIQHLIRIVLEKQGHQVMTAAHGEQAFEKLEAGRIPDLIILDIMMPGIDGLKVLEKLKQNKATQNIPVILLSALAKENIVLRGIQLGAKGYIRKPFHPNDLIKRVMPFLAQKAS